MTGHSDDLPVRCAWCGKKATGLASITLGGVTRRYCHGDDDAEPTCYETSQRLTFATGTYDLPPRTT